MVNVSSQCKIQAFFPCRQYEVVVTWSVCTEPRVPGNLLQSCLVRWVEFTTDDLNELLGEGNWDPYFCSLGTVSRFQVLLSPFQAYRWFPTAGIAVG